MADEIVVAQRTEITPLQLIQDALRKDVAPEVLRELVALQQSMVRFQWEAEERQSKIDFDDALNACQEQIGRVAPNQQRKDTNSWWADYTQLDRTIRPIYTGKGFALSYSEIASLVSGKVRIQATLSRKGISKEFSTEITPSTVGPKGGVMATATDADAIAASRAKRYLLLDIFNISIGIDAQEKAGIPELEKYLTAIQTTPDTEALKNVYQSALKVATEAKDDYAVKVLAEAKNKRYKELAHA